jgi:nucleoid-associated protein YgaU
MPRDARFGFVLGVALVIVIAVIFYHGDGKAGLAGNLGSARAGAKTSAAPGLPPVKAVRTHVVQDGETLTSIAVKYYEDSSRTDLLYRANRSQLRSPDQVPIGTVLIVPEVPAEK